jgi:hypothetical protein
MSIQMDHSEIYEANLKQLKRNITAQKTIYKFRTFMYSVNRDIRQHFFNISRSFFINERQHNVAMTMTENARLTQLLEHWDWDAFESASVQWWHILAMQFSHSITLLTLIHLWIDDIQTFDPDAFETSTQGLA